MVSIKSIKITPLARDKFFITWEFEPTIEDLREYELTLEKSEAPHDGYVPLAKIKAEDSGYIDDDIVIFKLWKRYYVRMRITGPDDFSYVSEPGAVEHSPNLEALELIRRSKISLENPRYGNGVPCLIYLRKEGGQRCPECFDPIKRRNTKTNCLNCYGTSYDGGYYKSIQAYINTSVDNKSMEIASHGNIITTGNSAIMANYPIVKSGDVVIDDRLMRAWTIIAVKNIERRRHVVKQILTMREEERQSVLFNLLTRE